MPAPVRVCRGGLRRPVAPLARQNVRLVGSSARPRAGPALRSSQAPPRSGSLGSPSARPCGLPSPTPVPGLRLRRRWPPPWPAACAPVGAAQPATGLPFCAGARGPPAPRALKPPATIQRVGDSSATATATATAKARAPPAFTGCHTCKAHTCGVPFGASGLDRCGPHLVIRAGGAQKQKQRQKHRRQTACQSKHYGRFFFTCFIQPALPPD
jgi:hypothetical protein